MRTLSLEVGFLCAFLLFSLLSALPTADSDVPDSSESAPSPKELWTFTVINSSWSNPVIANGIAYVFSTEQYTKPSEKHVSLFGPPPHHLVTVYALNVSDGSKLWEYTAEGELQRFTVANDTAYFSTSEGWCVDKHYLGAHIFAIDALTGAEKWVHNVDGMIFASRFDGDNSAFYVLFVASGSLDSFVSAVNVTNGKESWIYKFGNHIYPIPVAIGEEAMYFGLSNCFYALNETDGKIIWNSTLDSSISEAAVLGEDVVYVKSQQMTYALNPQNGYQLWNYSSYSYCISRKGIGYVQEGDAVYAFEGVSDDKIWSYSANKTINSLKLVDDRLYVCLNGTLTALNAVNGTPFWNYSIPQMRFVFSPYYQDNTAKLLISEDKLFCYSGKTLHAIDISNGEDLWAYTDYDHTFLTVTDGVAFFKSAHTLYAFSIPAIVPSTSQSTTAQPAEPSMVLGFTIELLIVVSIVAISAVLLTMILVKKRIQKTPKN
ncbi:MAG: PQQ-binding-like beta-propeller repeat protein [Candidatus Bathyarchaeota archaeon]|nr:PQQ-binding-like beta-propeller repeat protein [Candidatus Bathyarchaeota archaeon]